MIQIKNGRIFIEGKETTDPTHIGYAVIDAVESDDIVIYSKSRLEKEASELIKTAFDAGLKAGEIIERIGNKISPVSE